MFAVIILDMDEIATAVDAYLVSHGIHVSGPRTIRMERPDDDTTNGVVIVDPSGKCIEPDGFSTFDRIRRT
jgi:hypothetical protein